MTVEKSGRGPRGEEEEAAGDMGGGGGSLS